MDHPKDRMADFAIFSTLLIMGFLYICISDRQTFFPLQKFRFQPSTTYNMTIYRDELDEALAKASMEDKTVILAVVNKAYAEGDKPMLDLFLDGFWVGEDTRGLIEHLLVVAVDQTSFERCKFLKLHCYKLETQGIDFGGEQLYMSEDYIKMMWRRTLFLGDVLKRGYNFIFTDTDILWLRNPFPRLTVDVDLQISTDKFNGKEWSEGNYINTGLYMMRSNDKTIALLDELYARKEGSKGLKEQDVLLNLMHGGIFKRLGLKNTAPRQTSKMKDAQAVALRIGGDKAAFYNCKIKAFQDTLFDLRGRHFFKDCYIEGTYDFIWGGGKSLYLNVETHIIPGDLEAVITAQQRESASEDNGYSFVHCTVTGGDPGRTSLGRAWRPFPKVVFAFTEMGDAVNPKGWFDNRRPEDAKNVFYGEYNNKGPGADLSKRADFVKKLTDAEAKPFITLAYIEGSKWLLPPPTL